MNTPAGRTITRLTNSSYLLDAATVIGIAVGALIALVPIIDQLRSPLVVAHKATPKVTLAPLLVIWFGKAANEADVEQVADLLHGKEKFVYADSGYRGPASAGLSLMGVRKRLRWLQLRCNGDPSPSGRLQPAVSSNIAR